MKKFLKYFIVILSCLLIFTVPVFADEGIIILPNEGFSPIPIANNTTPGADLYFLVGDADSNISFPSLSDGSPDRNIAVGDVFYDYVCTLNGYYSEYPTQEVEIYIFAVEKITDSRDLDMNKFFFVSFISSNYEDYSRESLINLFSSFDPEDSFLYNQYNYEVVYLEYLYAFAPIIIYNTPSISGPITNYSVSFDEPLMHSGNGLHISTVDFFLYADPTHYYRNYISEIPYDDLEDAYNDAVESVNYLRGELYSLRAEYNQLLLQGGSNYERVLALTAEELENLSQGLNSDNLGEGTVKGFFYGIRSTMESLFDNITFNGFNLGTLVASLVAVFVVFLLLKVIIR